MNPMISIIVPVYKVEEYIDRCVNSLIKQTYKNIEIILVDDGSPDECPILCDQYASTDSRIHVVHKVNGGLSDARNKGIEASTGEYILFVDSDDYIDLDTCEKFVNLIGKSKPEIVTGNGRRIEGTNVKFMKHTLSTTINNLTGEEYLREELKHNTMFMAAWLNLYNREFLNKNNLEFKQNRLHEDEEFTPRAFLKAKNILSSDINFYNYIIREESITTNKDLSKNALDIMKTCYELSEIYNEISDVELKKFLNDSLVTKYLYAFQIGKLYKKKYNNFVNKKFVYNKAYLNQTKLKAFIFCTNQKLYYILNKIMKNLAGE